MKTMKTMSLSLDLQPLLCSASTFTMTSLKRKKWENSLQVKIESLKRINPSLPIQTKYTWNSNKEAMILEITQNFQSIKLQSPVDHVVEKPQVLIESNNNLLIKVSESFQYLKSQHWSFKQVEWSLCLNSQLKKKSNSNRF